MSAAAQEKFTNVRRKLDQLGYRQPLSLESLPLAERLLSDLVWTTESLRKAKKELDKKFEVKGSVEEYVEPYKSDNGKLARENNELHQKILAMREEQESSLSELKSSLRVLERENDDLKFFNSQCLAKLKVLERESKEKSDRISQLQEKNFQAVVHTPGGKRKAIPFRRQRMDTEGLLPSAEDSNRAGPSTAAPVVFDLKELADQRIKELTSDIERLREELEISARKMANFRKQVDLRDQEIGRLTQMMEGGRPYDVVSLEAKTRSDERLIAQLKLQNDLLQDRNREMEKRLLEAEDKLHVERKQELDLDAKNQMLSQELRQVDRMARSLKAENEEALLVADHEVGEAVGEMDRLRKQLRNMSEKVDILEKERRKLEDSLALSKKVSTEAQLDAREMQEVVERVSEDKRKLALRIEKLTANERALVLEIERLKRKGVASPGKKSRLSQVEAYMRGIEQDRDYWRGEAELLSRVIRSNGGPANGSRATSPKPGSQRGSRAGSPVRRSATPKKDKILENTIRLLEEERDHFKREAERLKAASPPPRARSPALRSPPVRDCETDLELMKARRERDDLQQLLNKFERHFGEIQGNVRVLTSEKESLNRLYEDTRAELNRLRTELLSSPKSPKVSLAAQAVLKRVETERDDAVADLRRMTTERDSLRERLRLSTETALSDKAKAEQRIEDLQIAARKAGSERDEYMTRTNTLRQRCLELEEQNKSLARQLAEKNSDLQDQTALVQQLRAQVEVLQRQAESSDRHGAQLDSDLREAEDRVRILQDRLSAVERELKAQREEAAQLRSGLAQMDAEKDGLQAALDDKTERLVQLEVDLRAREHALSECRGTLTAAEQQLARMQEVTASRDRESKSLRKQTDALASDLSGERRRCDQLGRENARLQEDLSTMARENQSLQAELQDTAEEREELRVRVQDFVAEVQRAEELLGAKERERAQLLEQYRQLSAEADRYQAASSQLQGEASGLRGDLKAREADVQRLRDELDAAQLEAKEQRHALHSYELQVSSLTRSLSDLEEQLRSQMAEKDELLRDLGALRDLCARLESGKDALQRQLTTKALDVDQMGAQVDDLNHEVSLLRDQLSTEQENVKNLETILSTSREKEFQSQLDVQERGAELSMLRDRLELNDTKLEQQQRELSRLRARNNDLEAEVERLHRAVTSEKYEKERAVQELRRLGASYRGGSSGPYTSPTPRGDGDY